MENLLKALENKYSYLSEISIKQLEDNTVLVQYNDGKGLVWDVFNDTQSAEEYLKSVMA